MTGPQPPFGDQPPQQQPYQPWPGHPYGPPPPPARKSNAWKWGLGIIVAIIVFGTLGNNNREQARSGLDTATTASTSRAAAPVPAPAAPVLPPAGPRTSFGDGTHVVGVDIEPGTYRSTGAQEGFFEFCSFSRLKEASSDSDALSVGAVNANEPIVITIKPSDGAFRAAGCNPFTKVG